MLRTGRPRPRGSPEPGLVAIRIPGLRGLSPLGPGPRSSPDPQPAVQLRLPVGPSPLPLGAAPGGSRLLERAGRGRAWPREARAFCGEEGAGLSAALPAEQPLQRGFPLWETGTLEQVYEIDERLRAVITRREYPAVCVFS